MEITAAYQAALNPKKPDAATSLQTNIQFETRNEAIEFLDQLVALQTDGAGSALIVQGRELTVLDLLISYAKDGLYTREVFGQDPELYTAMTELHDRVLEAKRGV